MASIFIFGLAVRPEAATQTQPPASSKDLLCAISYGIVVGGIASQLLGRVSLKTSAPILAISLIPFGMYGRFGLCKTNDWLRKGAKTIGSFLWKHQPLVVCAGIILLALALERKGRISVTWTKDFSDKAAGVILSHPPLKPLPK